MTGETTRMKISRRKLSRIHAIDQIRVARDVRESFLPRYTTGNGRYHARAHTSCRPCDSFNQLAKKLVTCLVASLERTPGKRRLARNRLPL